MDMHMKCADMHAEDFGAGEGAGQGGGRAAGLHVPLQLPTDLRREDLGPPAGQQRPGAGPRAPLQQRPRAGRAGQRPHRAPRAEWCGSAAVCPVSEYCLSAPTKCLPSIEPAPAAHRECCAEWHRLSYLLLRVLVVV